MLNTINTAIAAVAALAACAAVYFAWRAVQETHVARREAEEDRKMAELDRQKADSDRRAAEQDRRRAEEARQRAAQDRKQDEQDRRRHRLERVLRPGSWSRPAGVSPVRVDTGGPGSRPRFVVERRRAERGVESLFGGSEHAGRSLKRTLQPRQSHNAGAEPLMSRRRPCLAGPVPGQPAGSCRGREGGTCAWSGPEQERPVCLACVGQR